EAVRHRDQASRAKGTAGPGPALAGAVDDALKLVVRALWTFPPGNQRGVDSDSPREQPQRFVLGSVPLTAKLRDAERRARGRNQGHPLRLCGTAKAFSASRGERGFDDLRPVQRPPQVPLRTNADEG